MSRDEVGASTPPSKALDNTSHDGIDASVMRVCMVVPAVQGTPAERAGVLPDMRDWVAGDVVLFASSGKFNGLIEAVQRRAWHDAAIWTHAALYADDGYLIESIFSLKPGGGGVKRRPISEYSPQRGMIRLHDAKLSDDERRALVAGVHKVAAKYDVVGAVAIGLDALGVPGITRPNPVAHSGRYVKFPKRSHRQRTQKAYAIDSMAAVRACVCSDLIDLAYTKIIGDTAAPQVRRFVPPAALFRSPRFTHHDVRLCRLAPPASG